MSASTSKQFNFLEQIIPTFQNTVEESSKQGFRMIWSLVQGFIVENPMFMSLILVGFFLLALFNYFATGRWAMLGSVMYNYLYFGALYLVALFFGTDIFTSVWVDIFLFILYIVCFTMVGKLLTWAGIRKARY